MVPYKYTEEHSKLKYKAMAVRGHELEIRQEIAKEMPYLSVKKRNEYAWMMANYAGGSRYGRFQPIEPYDPSKDNEKDMKVVQKKE